MHRLNEKESKNDDLTSINSVLTLFFMKKRILTIMRLRKQRRITFNKD